MPPTNGNDSIIGLPGPDLINALAGNDIVVGDPLLGPYGNDTLNGGSGHDQLYGLGGADLLDGSSGNDWLFGGPGNDQLFGGTGNDRLKGGLGHDLLNGGADSDTADYSTLTIDPPGPIGSILNTGAISGVTVNLFGGNGQATGGAGTDQLVSIENLTGSSFVDRLSIEGMDSSTVNGGAGNDELGASFAFGATLNGGAGNDRLFLGTGTGTLNGGNGNDELTISDGDFIVNGGSGNDVIETVPIAFTTFATVTGGAGTDFINLTIDDEVTCVYNEDSDSPTGVGRDVITGFDGESGDQIDLSNINVTGLSYAGEILNINTDSDAAAEMEIQLIGAPSVFPYIII
jgi:Ca2+-binding RTX toxin-like protein